MNVCVVRLMCYIQNVKQINESSSQNHCNSNQNNGEQLRLNNFITLKHDYRLWEKKLGLNVQRCDKINTQLEIRNTNPKQKINKMLFVTYKNLDHRPLLTNFE